MIYFGKTWQLELENINLQKSNLFHIWLPEYSMNKKLMGETNKNKDSKDDKKTDKKDGGDKGWVKKLWYLIARERHLVDRFRLEF